ncbi:tRNA-dihydrouridine16/17 synthase NADP+-like [Hondaea fermentalgiana]|uniref:tRNA-dihydrouridine(16/17) synthase [NAD(P)(+)] n=1 Tax=Hondaea fermentalgiana TaxID=2315210 RepID=A0A2R5GAX7_9STRA|nr:tRNA-dihydrouridine16/17 synthase NADP+-like [Hondaea fermentalgiana]|eukprot:GBG24844.1 tRNA-dihydrouridine16/17 synthase NADP+-like [Hondaea fermentalgiana]
MVRGSERAFRELVRAQSVHLCYLPMIQAAKLVAGEPYEHSLIDVDGEESPVVAQLAGRDADELVAAGRLIQDKVAAIDLNLGCPQICAKRGRYGAFLLEEPDLVVSIVRAMSSALTCPVWCKIRLLETPEATLVFAKQLEEAGCSLLAIHARTRAQLGEGPVDLDTLHAVADALEIPVVANGGFANKTAADKLLDSTPVSAVMFASELLANPRLLTDETPMDDALAVRRAEEYLEYALRYPVPDHRHLEVHLRHILRRTVKNRPELIRWWSLLSRPWMKSPWQYLCMLALMAQARGLPAMDLGARFPDRTPLRTMPELRRPELVANPKNAKVNLKSTMPQNDTSTVLHDDKPNGDTAASAQDT